MTRSHPPVKHVDVGSTPEPVEVVRFRFYVLQDVFVDGHSLTVKLSMPLWPDDRSRDQNRR
jgi:hypothetical protein